MKKAAFLGIDLQMDMASTNASFKIPGWSEAVAAAGKLAEHAIDRGIPLLLSLDTHEEDDPCLDSFPSHCLIGTPGHEIVPELKIGDHTIIPNEPLLSFELTPGQPVLIHSPDHRRGIFGNINADRVLSLLDADEYVLFGLPTEIGVRAAGFGLRERQKTTIIVSDGIAHLDPHSSASHLTALAGAGCNFLTTSKILERYE